MNGAKVRLGWQGWAVCGLILLATILTLRWLTFDLLYGDEWWAIYTSGGAYYGPLTLGQIWHNVTVVDLSGMFSYNFLLAGWNAILGGSVFSVRVLSLLFGVLAIAMTYRAAGLLFGRRVGVIAAAVLATSAFHIDFMHEVRTYSLYVLMTAAVLVAYVELVRRPNPSRWRYVILSLASAGVAYAHYLGFLAYCGLGFYHIIVAFAPKNQNWRRVLTALILGGIFYVPFFPVILQGTANGEADYTRQYYSLRAGAAILEILRVFSHSASLILVGLLALSLISLREKAGRLVWAMLVSALAAALIINALLPFIVHPRYLMFVWPLLAILTALGFEQILRRWRIVWVGVLLWAILGISTSWASMDFARSVHGYAPRAPAAGVIAARDIVARRAGQHDLVIFHAAWQDWEQMNLYALDYVMRPTRLRFEQIEYMNTSWERDLEKYREDVTAGLNRAERVWVVIVPDVPISERSEVFWDVFLEDYSSCGDVLNHRYATMTLYQRHLPDGSDAPCLP